MEKPLGIMKVNHFLFLSIIIGVFFSCNNNQNSNNNKPTTVAPKDIVITPPAFDADTAYSFVKTQVDFTPRIPGSKAHDKCAEYLTNKLK